MSKLDEIVKQVNKDWKENIASRGVIWKKLPKIPFTSPRLNYMLYGGIQRGRLHEFSGPEGGGKTSTALDLCKNAQKLFQEEYEEKLSNAKDEKEKAFIEAIGPQKVVYADCENTLDEEWARTLGVDVDGMYILKPQTQAAEDIFQIVLDMLNTGECGLAIIDSLGVMMSKQAYEKSMDEKTYGGISMPLTLFSKKAELACHKYNATVIGINQERADMNNPYGGTTTPGGMGWKYNCFSGNTKLLTDKGIKRFRDFQDGETLTVVDMNGDLREATMHYYGNNNLQKVVLKTPSMIQEVICTQDHRWVLEDGSITTELKVGDKLYVRKENVYHEIKTNRQAEMFCLGMILGDGSDCKPAYEGDTICAKIVLCGRKENYSKYFKMAFFRETIQSGNKCYYKRGLSKQDFLNCEGWKYLTPEDKRYLFMGYYAADGLYGGSECCTFDYRVLQFIKDCSGMCGYYIASIKESVTKEDTYKPGQTNWKVKFTTHQNKCNKWVVHSISRSDKAGTYCVEEPITHTFTLEKGIVTGNCTTRLRFSKGDLLDEDGNKLTRSSEFAAGNRVMVGLLKQKGDKPDRRLSFYTLTYENGIDEIADLIEVALKYGYIQKGGAWFSFVDIETGEIVTDEEGKEIKIQGQSNVAKLLRENEVLLDELKDKIYSHF